jgi:hypothetical protein
MVSDADLPYLFIGADTNTSIQSKFFTASSVTFIVLAFVLSVVPNLRQYVLSAGSQPISEELAHIHTLAAAQNYTYTTVFTDPLVIYLDNFLSVAEIELLLNERYGGYIGQED